MEKRVLKRRKKERNNIIAFPIINKRAEKFNKAIRKLALERISREMS